jgi:hypothetical protein
VLGIACRECPPRVVRQMLGVTHSGQALTPRCIALILRAMVVPAWQVALIELREGLGAALSKVSSRSSLVAVVNQAVMPGLEG